MSGLAEFLSSLPYFKALSREEIARITRETRERSLGRGEVLFLEGEPYHDLYAVKSGRVRIFKSSPDGREQVIFVAGEGDTFNDVAVFDSGPTPASASALEAATVYIIPGRVILSLLDDCPAAQSIIEVFAKRLRHLTTVVENLSFRTVVSRLAKLLLEMATVQEGSSPVPRLTQEEMAAMVGSVRDVVGRALRALEKAGAIKIQGQRILVSDAGKLKKMT